MVFPSAITGPIAPYSNVPINPQYYVPRQYFISTIVNGATTLVTTTTAHNYVVGQQVKLLIPMFNKIIELNNKTGFVISIPAANQVVIDINSNLYNIFQTSTYPTQPQILAIGDINSGNINISGNVNTGTFIPGSFIDISPL